MVNHLPRKHLLKETLIITLLIILATFALQYYPISSEIAKPIKQESNDFDVYDLIYSGKAIDNHKRDTNIVIFQAADTRQQIAAQLRMIQSFHPSVIGVDLTFIGHPDDDPMENALLQHELSASNIVTGNTIAADSVTNKQKIIPNFFDRGSEKNNAGYFNFSGNEISVVRYYPPFLKIDNRWAYAFTSRIAEKYDSSAFKMLEKKGKNLLVINYLGNIESFSSFTKGDFDTARLAEIVPGKIVLLGVLYKRFPLVLEDLHFTPLNDKMNGKSFPDMYGVVIHANILSMILSNNYVISVPRTWSYLLAGLITFLLVYFKLNSFYAGKHFSDLLFFFLQFILVIIIVLIFLEIDKGLHYKVALSPIVMPVILCIEIIEVYKFLVKRLLKKSGYQSVFFKNK